MIVTAISHPNIALIKYWGKRDTTYNLPSVSSVSLTLSNFSTKTTVEWGYKADILILNEKQQTEQQAKRVFQFLNIIDPQRPPCRVESQNNFPTAAGLASSSSAFAALALAATAASGHSYSETELSALARRGSGSACRSIWGGWVHWQKGSCSVGSDSHGIPIASPEHWDVCMVIAVVSDQKKDISSTLGMQTSVATSPFYASWVETSQQDVDTAIRAIHNKDIHSLGASMEHSTIKMHSTMMCTKPSIRYWKPQSLSIIDLVEELRKEGFSCYQTMDAGPNVKILCPKEEAEAIANRVRQITPCHIVHPGSHARLI